MKKSTGSLVVYRWGNDERSGRVIQQTPSGYFVKQNGLNSKAPGWGEVFHITDEMLVDNSTVQHREGLVAFA